MTKLGDDDLLAEQRAFYQARAPEYDEWWQRRGRYAADPQLGAEWDEQVALLDEALDAFDPSGDVLELAGGTGWWTERLARVANRLTVVDASEETLSLNRQRVARPDVDYILADLFTWRPARAYEVVFFSFWLSHVPRSRFENFWQLVRSCLAPGGRVFLIDNRNDPLRPTMRDPYVLEYGTDVHRRQLSDGRQFRVVKVMYEPEELQQLLEGDGWTAQIRAIRFFIFGSAALSAQDPEEARAPARR